ncbi:MAG: acetyl-CoA C-acyltransferase, partial [Pseudomonadota bacterium]
MAEAFIYDAVRTPRGKGKKDGSLHEITPLQLSAQVLDAIPTRMGIEKGEVEDVAFGCVSPFGEQGAVITRTAILAAGYPNETSGIQVNRFCGSGLEATNIAAAKVMSGECDLAIGGGVESMSRVPMGSDGGAMVTDPQASFDAYFVPQGISADLIATKYGFSRDDVDAYAVESHKRATKAWDEGRFDKSILPVKDVMGVDILSKDETIRPSTDMQALGALNPSFAMLGQNFGFNDVAQMRYPEVEKINHVHHAGNSSGIVDGAAAVLLGNKATGERLGMKPRARIKS